jgi:hypothetical protein
MSDGKGGGGRSRGALKFVTLYYMAWSAGVGRVGPWSGWAVWGEQRYAGRRRTGTSSHGCPMRMRCWIDYLLMIVRGSMSMEDSRIHGFMDPWRRRVPAGATGHADTAQGAWTAAALCKDAASRSLEVVNCRQLSRTAAGLAFARLRDGLQLRCVRFARDGVQGAGSWIGAHVARLMQHSHGR